MWFQRNVDKFLEKTNILLNTESKRVLWFYLEKILDEFHKPIVHEPVEITSTIRSTKSPSYRLLNKLVPKKDIYASHNFLDKSNELQTVSRMNSLINSRKFRSTPSLNTFHSTQAGEMMFKLSKQVGLFQNHSLMLNSSLIFSSFYLNICEKSWTISWMNTTEIASNLP